MFHNQASCSESTTKNRDQKPSRFHSRRCLELLLLMALGCSVAAAQCNVYVADRETNSVSVFNTLNNSLMAMVPVGNQPLRVAITPNGAFAYVTNSGSNNVSVINTATNTVVATVPVGSNPAAVSITPNGAFAYVTNYLGNNVSVIDTATNTVVATVAVGNDPV